MLDAARQAELTVAEELRSAAVEGQPCDETRSGADTMPEKTVMGTPFESDVVTSATRKGSGCASAACMQRASQCSLSLQGRHWCKHQNAHAGGLQQQTH